jgi:CubicO group peptidase (beta-lactamase class C family)
MKTPAMRGLVALALCVFALGIAVVARAQAPDDELEGLWTAARRFGPEARGPLVIQASGRGYVADFVGRRLPLHEERGELVFALPDQLGWFRGRREGKAFTGHWYQPGSPVNVSDHAVAATPIHFAADGPGRWRGLVAPPEETFTFHLRVMHRDDGTYAAVLRNPERDYGTLLGVHALRREGDAVVLLGRDDREVARGTFDREAQALTLDTRGGSYDFRRARDDSDYWPRGRVPGRYAYAPPLARDDGWPVATLAEEGIDQAAVERLVQSLLDAPMDSADAPQVHGVLVARHGRLVLEEYFHGEHRDKPHQTRSASKSAVSVLIGAAMRDGAPLRLDSPVYAVMNDGAFPADLEPAKRTMTLEHLLTMSSGLWCDDTDPKAPGNEDAMEEQTDEPDRYRFFLRVPLATPPGQNAVYCSGSPNLALGMLAHAGGENPLYRFDRLVAAPMRFGTYVWGLDAAGNLYGGGGVQFLPRDFLKFGQLMLDGGSWRGHRILDADFAARAVAPRYHLRNVTYGYLWWSETYPYKDRTVHVWRAAGAGGQLVNVIPELDLVVAIYGANYSSRVQAELHHIVPRWLLPAVREPGDDLDAPVLPRGFTSPYGPSKDGSRVATGTPGR